MNLKNVYVLLFNLVLLNLGILPATLAESASPEIKNLEEVEQFSTNAQDLIGEPQTKESKTLAQAESDQKTENQEADIDITVTGTRSERPVKDTPGNITVIQSEDVDRQLINDLADLIRYEPGVSVGNSRNRGNQDFTIRGIGGNRVLIQVDGIRIPDNYTATSTSRNYFDLETLKRVEIIRGPASTLYGSDAIGGAVSFITKDPDDYLLNSDGPSYASVKYTYDSTDESRKLTGVIAAESEDGKLQISAALTNVTGSEFKNYGTAIADPQDSSDLNFIGKIVFKPNDTNTFKLTGERFNSKSDTNLLSSLGTSRGTTTFDNFADYQNQRYRISLGQEYDNPNNNWLQKLRWQVYYQDAQASEEINSLRGRGAVATTSREDVNSFEQSVFGGDIQFESNFQTGRIDHRLVYGLEVFNTDTSRPRDRTETDLVTGAINKFVGGETYPNKTFPDTETLRFRVYAQDEIEFPGNRLTLIPGLSFDYYKLTANPDQDFQNINIDNYDVKDFDASAFSPKLGIVYKVTPELSTYAQYARGFRSPPYDDANIAFTNFLFGYTVLPNNNLKPETSDSYEIGIKGSYSQLNFGLSGFYNRYNNFIDTEFVGLTSIGGRNFQQFQSQNIEGAEIYGLEAKAEYRLSPSKYGLSLIGSLAWAEGNNLQNNQPLDTVDPFQAVVGLRYRAPEDRWGSELVTTFVAANQRAAESGTDLFIPDSSFNLDLLGYYKFSDKVSLNVGLFNLLDKKYWRWQDVRGLTNNSPEIARRTLPGFNATVGLKVAF
ncbi:MAG: TonB-dependent hemoglobin/transferrin/lactoferrin family receptor [Rivularia sp. T60_A2020_040]|nr:TonB-dependent hemoglobin/transferrin/lactoferrin family receptor [Rivularia sp. T60_A2020_040]